MVLVFMIEKHLLKQDVSILLANMLHSENEIETK